MSRDEIANSLRLFKSRRDNLLHEDVATFEHHLERFLEFCANDSLAHSVVATVEGRDVDVDAWWSAATQHDPQVSFPSNADEEFALRYRLIQSVASKPDHVFQLGNVTFLPPVRRSQTAKPISLRPARTPSPK